VRKVILKNLDKDYEEGMQYGMIAYFVPHRVYPAGYHCNPKQPLPFACLASQKNHMSLYLMSVYCMEGESTWFAEAWASTGKKADMGKSCVRFKTLDDLALDVIAKAIRRFPAKKYIQHWESVLQSAKHRSTKKTRGTRTTSSESGGRKRRIAPKSEATRSKRAPSRSGV
jgi:hypothetical protein